MIDSLRWLGIDWDEGPEVGGPYGPYRQSERFDIYADVAARLREAGAHLRLLLHHRRGRGAPQGLRLQDARGTTASAATSPPSSVAAFAGRGPRRRCCGSGCPTAPITFDDLVRGEVTFQPEHVPDFALVRANGDPLYTLVNPVDDALMEITHVLRGEDLLSSTPRQIALYQTPRSEIGVGNGAAALRPPAVVMGEGNKKLSKRDPRLRPARLPRPRLPARGPAELPRPARLGDRRRTATSSRSQEMVEAFDIRRVNPNPARFDLKKARGDQRRPHAAARRSTT